MVASISLRFIESSEPLWSSGRLYDKAVTVFADEPEHLALDSVLHSIYDALYRWGAVIVGPKAFELEREVGPSTAEPRLRSAQYRALRLARLAGLLSEERTRRGSLEVAVGARHAAYRLVYGEPLATAHHGRPVTVSSDKTIRRPIPPSPAREPPIQPAGRAPTRRQPPR